MNLFICLLSLVFCVPLMARQFVIAGDNYLLFQGEDDIPVLVKGVEPKSWALDSEHCALWLTTQSSENGLQLYENGELKKQIEFAGNIVSDFEKGHFFTQSASGSLEMRDHTGQVTSKIQSFGPSVVKKVVRGHDGELWTLGQKNQKVRRDFLMLSQISPQGQIVKSFEVESGVDLWGGVQLAFDPSSKDIWVGYSSSSAEHTYTPRVKLFSSSGQLKHSYHWPDRGLFFDGCLEDSGSFVMARDIPTMPFTVPVYSFLERLEPSGPAKAILNLDLNLLVDSLTCHAQEIYLSVHSILGGEGRQILRWNKATQNEPEVLVKLPSRPNKMWACEKPTT